MATVNGCSKEPDISLKKLLPSYSLLYQLLLTPLVLHSCLNSLSNVVCDTQKISFLGMYKIL